MRTFCLSGIAMFVVGFLGFVTESVCAQYLPPAIGNAFQPGTVPDLAYPEKKPELKGVLENQNSKFIYREYETNELQVPPEQFQIVIVPVADPRSQGQVPKVTFPGSGQPQQISGMSPQTIYYFPPPTFPEPIPLTVYRPDAPQQQYQTPPQTFSQPTDDQMGGGQTWSPYNSLYGPPMITQPHYFGPPKQEKTRRFKKSGNPGATTAPGEPVVGPPTLVYPNGIVVRPKVYLPQQPFKNAVRAMTP